MKVESTGIFRLWEALEKASNLAWTVSAHMLANKNLEGGDWFQRTARLLSEINDNVDAHLKKSFLELDKLPPVDTPKAFVQCEHCGCWIPEDLMKERKKEGAN